MNLSVIANLSRDVLHFFFPVICTLCGDRLSETDQVICDRCRLEMPRVLDPVCRRCGNPAVRIASDTCRLCRKMKPAFDCARAVAIYAGPAEQLVRDLKYASRLELGPVMAGMMVVAWERSMAFEGMDIVIPVPLHPARRRERGFNQAEHIAAPFAEMMKRPMLTEAVVRVRPTVSQTTLDLDQRVENVDGAFKPAEATEEDLAGKSVVLIDDVCTTGATGSACAEAIKRAGAVRVVLFTYARAAFST